LRRESATAKEKTNKWRVVAFIAAGLFGLGCLLGAMGLALILHAPPPPAIHTDPLAAQRLEQELVDAQASATNGASRVVEADETEINSMLKRQFEAATNGTMGDSAAVVRDMKMTLVDDRLRLYVLARLHGKDITFQVEGRLQTLNGYMNFDPISGRIGSLPLPKASLRSAMERMLANPESFQTMRLPKNVGDLHVESGKLVVVFR